MSANFCQSAIMRYLVVTTYISVILAWDKKVRLNDDNYHLLYIYLEEDSFTAGPRIGLFMFVYIPPVINLNMQNPHPVSAPSVIVISHVGLNSVKNWHFIEWGCWVW